MNSFKAQLLNGLIWRFGYYLSAFILNILIAQYWGAAKSGIFYLLLNNLAFIVLLLSVGIDSAIGYFNSRKELSFNQLLSLGIVWPLASAVIIAGCYYLGIRFHLVTEIRNGFFLLIYITGSLITTLLSAVIFSWGNNKTPNRILTSLNIILIILLSFNQVLLKSSSSDLYIRLYLLASGLAAIFFFIFLLQNKINFHTQHSSFILQKDFIKFASQSFLFSLLYTLLLRCDYWIVNYFCSDADLGNYMQTSKLNQLILLIPSLISFTLFPLIVSQVHQQKMIELKVVKLMRMYLFIGISICIFIIITGYWLLPVLYGQSFSKMYPVFILLSPGILFLAAAYPLNTFFAGKNLIEINIKANLLSIIVLLVLDFSLIKPYNIYGAAVASTAGYAFYFFYLLIRFRKMFVFEIKSLFNFKELINKYINAPFDFNSIK